MDPPRITTRVVALESAEAADARMGGMVDERVGAVTALTLEAWRLAGLPLPCYTRETMPVSIGTLAERE